MAVSTPAGRLVACRKRPGRFHRDWSSEAWRRCCRDQFVLIEVYPPTTPYVRLDMLLTPTLGGRPWV